MAIRTPWFGFVKDLVNGHAGHGEYAMGRQKEEFPTAPKFVSKKTRFITGQARACFPETKEPAPTLSRRLPENRLLPWGRGRPKQTIFVEQPLERKIYVFLVVTGRRYVNWLFRIRAAGLAGGDWITQVPTIL